MVAAVVPKLWMALNTPRKSDACSITHEKEGECVEYAAVKVFSKCTNAAA